MCSSHKAAMSVGLFRMLRYAFLVICVTGMIAIFGLYKYQVKIVKVATIIMPGEPNVQINVSLLVMTALTTLLEISRRKFQNSANKEITAFG